MSYGITMRLPIDVFSELCDYLETNHIEDEFGDVIGAFIRDWIAVQQRAERVDHAPGKRATLEGFQWKGLFLPAGTQLRTTHAGEHYYAEVVGHRVMFDGEASSPSAFANSMAGTQRSAWRTVWLLFPGERVWQPARKACAVGAPVTAGAVEKPSHTSKYAARPPA